MKNDVIIYVKFCLVVSLVCLSAVVAPAVADDAGAENSSLVNETPIEVAGEITLSLSSDDGSMITKDGLVGSLPVGTVGGTSSIGVFRSGQFILNTAPISRITFGLSSDKPVTGDWDHDGKTEIGIFRPSLHQFILDYNNDGVADFRKSFGLSTDVPISGDWDGDGYDEIGVFRNG